MRRIVSIWLPRWPIDRLRWKARRETSCFSPAPPERAPFALTAASGNAIRLSAVNAAAAAHGLYTDMMLTDARSMVPDLLTAPAEPQADARALTRLARWLGRYSPWTTTDGADGVLLDVTGCAGLFGGEAKLLADMERRLTAFGFSHRSGLADTPGAAHALARYGPGPLAPPGGTAEALSTLPVEALRLDPDTVTLLKRLGLKRIGQLYDMPRAALARRFRAPEKRAAVLTRLDQALGLIDEPLSPLMPVPDYRAGLSLAEPVQEVAAVSLILERLAEDLCATLKESGLGAQRLSLLAYRVDGTLTRLRVGASRPTHDPNHIGRLFTEHLESLDAGFGIDRVVLGAERVGPLTVHQSALAPDTEGTAVDEVALARLIDRLAARFGEDAVTCLAPHDSHIPERAEHAVPALDPDAPLLSSPPERGRLPEHQRRKTEEDQKTKFLSSSGPGEARNPRTPCSIPKAGSQQTEGGPRVRAIARPEDDKNLRGVPHPPAPLTRRGPLPLPAGEGSSVHASSPLPRERLAAPEPWRRRGRVRGEDDKPPRPLLLFERPEPIAVMAQVPDGPPLRFRWRRVVREVARAQGPERIAPEWWLHPQGNTDDTRDYYRVEDSAGRRYWLYREGLYGTDRSEPPRWYVHGVFG